jgi:hypothetical protein
MHSGDANFGALGNCVHCGLGIAALDKQRSCRDQHVFTPLMLLAGSQ